MATNNLKLSIYIPPNAHHRLKAFQEAHNVKSLSSAATAILESYFGLTQGKTSTLVVAPTPDTATTNTLTERIDNLAARLVAGEKRSDDLSARLAVVEEEVGKYRYSDTTKPAKSLRPTQQSTKSQNAVYGRGEAASIYPGWELPANVSYVFDRFQTLNTDESKAAFADKWIGLCAQSLDTAWIVCYKLLSLIKEKEMYKIPHWMEGNKTYDSFKDYFEHRFKKPFETWSELESTYRFMTEACPELLEVLLAVENSLELTQNGTVEAVLPSDAHIKTTRKRSKTKVKKPRLSDTHKPELTSSETTEQIATDQGETTVIQKIEQQPDDFQPKLLTQTALSERLDVPRTTLRSKQAKMSESEFVEWTRSKDPEGIAWSYSSELKKYYLRSI